MVAQEFQSSIAPKGNRYFLTTLAIILALGSNPRSPRRAIATENSVLLTRLYVFQSSIAPKGNRYRRAEVCGLDRVFQSSIAPKGNRYARYCYNQAISQQFQSSIAPKGNRYNITCLMATC